MPAPEPTQPHSLVMHTLKLMHGIMLMIVGVIAAFYSISPAVRFIQTTGTENAAATIIFGAYGGISNAIVTMAQLNGLIKEIKKSLQNPTVSIDLKTRLLIAFLSISTLIGSFLLAMIQLRETKDIISYKLAFEFIIAANNALASELAQVIFGLGEIVLAKKLFQHFFIEVYSLICCFPNFTPARRRGSSANVSIAGDLDAQTVEEISYPKTSITLPVIIISTLLLLSLTACYIDEYFRMLPEGVGVVWGNTLAALSIPGVICIALLGFATINKMLETTSESASINKTNFLATTLFSLGASFWEFTMGTEVARENSSLGYILASICMLARTIINAPFVYEFLTDVAAFTNKMVADLQDFMLPCMPRARAYTSIP